MILNVIMIIVVMIIYILVLSAASWTVSTIAGAIAGLFRRLKKHFDTFTGQ